MENISEQYWGRALKLARQYESGQVEFADLTGLIDEFSAAFFEEIGGLSPSMRSACSKDLESRLTTAMNSEGQSLPCREAMSEILVALNRIPIY